MELICFAGAVAICCGLDPVRPDFAMLLTCMLTLMCLCCVSPWHEATLRERGRRNESHALCGIKQCWRHQSYAAVLGSLDSMTIIRC